MVNVGQDFVFYGQYICHSLKKTWHMCYLCGYGKSFVRIVFDTHKGEMTTQGYDFRVAMNDDYVTSMQNLRTLDDNISDQALFSIIKES